MTALGIAIGIASIVSVFGISASSKADLLAQIDEFGTDPAGSSLVVAWRATPREGREIALTV